ncbi:HNH endonuclease [Xanthomonas albilineans]|uniref:HNH endonuclease n=1 Tax=Xanthomonas albilineans TaxID=29447 RepID=UPI0005F33275
MPRKAPTPCRHPGCRKLVSDGSGYCADHQRDKVGWHKDRRNAHQRGYGAKWQKLRAFVMQRDQGLCQPCKQSGRLTPAVAVDHIVPKSQGGTDHPNNCQAICHRCHVLKTAQESHQGREGV